MASKHQWYWWSRLHHQWRLTGHIDRKVYCCSQASLPWFPSWCLWGHTPESHDQVNWVPDSGQRSQCQGFFAASLLHSVGCMAFHSQWLVYSEGSGQIIWKKVARRVKQSSVQGASFCTSGQVLAAASIYVISDAQCDRSQRAHVAISFLVEEVFRLLGYLIDTIYLSTPSSSRARCDRQALHCC